MRRKYILGALIFLFGGIAGYAVARTQLKFVKVSQPPQMAAKAELSKMGKKLKLSRQQKESLKAIINKNEASIQSLKNEFRPRYVALREGMKEEIKTVLNQEQQQKFSLMTSRVEATSDLAAPAAEDAAAPVTPAADNTQKETIIQ